MGEAWEVPLPRAEVVRKRFRYLMDRRNISQARLAQLTYKSQDGRSVDQSTISRYLNGGDLRYEHLQLLWNILLDAQLLKREAPIQEAMVPEHRIQYASAGMTEAEFEAELLSFDIDHAPYTEQGRVVGILSTRRIATSGVPWAGRTLSELLPLVPDALTRKAPTRYRFDTTIEQVRARMTAAIKEDPTAALAFVVKRRKVIGLVTPYNFIGVE